MRAPAWIIPAAVLAAIGLAAAAPGAAQAEWTAPELLTISPLEQADGISSSALSADGRYLVFAGSLDGVKGILRRDLQTGLTEVVAAAGAYDRGPLLDAGNPSISADGRFVSFTTVAALDPADDVNTLPDVYVRDMDAAVPSDGAPCAADGGPCAYTLVSAIDGGTVGLTYQPFSPGPNIPPGAAAAPRQAISADGRRVAFVVRSPSDLAGPDTPAFQVAVRDLDTRRTTLVSAVRDATTGAMTDRPVPGGAVVASSWAALSADGTTVAWSGQNVSLQAATVGGDPAARTIDPYNEPLWRRVADGPVAPIRRVAGAGDPEAPGCPPGGTIENPACAGPYPDLGANAESSAGLQGGWLIRPVDVLAMPSLSADGRTVAFLGGPPFAPDSTSDESADVFVADMRGGLARRDAVRRLTSSPASSERPHGDATELVSDLALSPDGRRVAFATSRLVFAGSPLFLADPPPAQSGLQELWLADLDGKTLSRLSRTVGGGPASLSSSATGLAGGVASPSFGAAGRMVAFDSPAANFVTGDTNDATDAFLVQEHTVSPGTAGRVDITPPPVVPPIARTWRFSLRAVAQKDGTVRLDADVPGPGRAARDGQGDGARVQEREGQEARRRAPDGAPADAHQASGGGGVPSRPRRGRQSPVAEGHQRLQDAGHREGRTGRGRERDIRRAVAHEAARGARRAVPGRQDQDHQEDESQAMIARLASALAALALAASAFAATAAADDWHSEQPLISGARVPAAIGRVYDIKFWAPNRGTLITAKGLWAYDGAGWHQLSTVCGGTDGRIAWAGPLDFWTISDQPVGQAGPDDISPVRRSLCHFLDGAVVASYAQPVGQAGSYLPMNAAACLAPDDCWFGGERLPGTVNSGAFHLHWNGTSLTAFPSLTVHDTSVTDPDRAVADMAVHQGTLYESVRVDGNTVADESGDQPVLLHQIFGGTPPSFVSQFTDSPIDYDDKPASTLGPLRLSSDGDALWAAAGTVDPNNKPLPVTVLRGGSGGIAPLTLTDAGGLLLPTVSVSAIAAEPGTGSAWVAYVPATEVGVGSSPARLARVHADGTVDDGTVLPSVADGIARKRQADQLACPAAGQCWMSTLTGWLFHLGGSLPRDDAPELHTLITYRPPDAATPVLPPDTLPDDDSGIAPPVIFQPPPIQGAAPQEKARKTTKAKPLITGVKRRTIKRTTLEMTFTLTAKARVQLVAKRKKTVVAKTKLSTLAKGKHRLRLKLSAKRWPTSLDLRAKPYTTIASLRRSLGR